MDNKELVHELKREVELWVDRSFNFIQLEVFERMSDNMLIEHIHQPQIDNDSIEDWLNSSGIEDEVKQEFIDYDGEHESEYAFDEPDHKLYEDHKQMLFDYIKENYEDDLREYLDNDNYPMWNTLFEFKSSHVPDEWDSAIQNCGMSIIEGLEPFNKTIFFYWCWLQLLWSSLDTTLH